ncbi:monooxygenase [Spongisporangium articulatum]|uniref:Monooxygenase n=1 Tax=Spongisporangium articulatum TaxID=3362603 RepID=A0ABW8ATY1_9ACTN
MTSDNGRRRPFLPPLAALVLVLAAATACGGGGDKGTSSPRPAETAVVGHAGHSATVATPKPIALRAGERFQTLGMARPYKPVAPTAGGTDDYRCFLVDPKITKPTFLTGFQFLPQNPDLVHHAIFYAISRTEAAEGKTLDANTPGDGWTCFTGTGIGDAKQAIVSAPWIAAWAPGGGETLSNPGTGKLLRPGEQIVMQVHYNLLATGGKSVATDQSAIKLRLTKRGGLEPVHTTLLVAPPEIPCPAGETGRLCDRALSLWDIQRRFGEAAGAQVGGLNLLCNDNREPVPSNKTHCDRKVGEQMVVQGVAGHMHLLGRSISVTQNPGTAGARKLLNVPNYNFDDQGARMLDKPVTVAAGDTLRVSCRYDATLRSKLPALQTLKPRYVLWGEGTSDEMCLGVVIWTKS